MSDKRKTIKVTIPADMVEAFNKCKSTAEQKAMIKLTDTQYASRLVQWAIDFQGETKYDG